MNSAHLKIRLRRWGLMLFLGLVAVGCGYRFPGGGGPPKGLETIFISMIENRTAEIGAEIVLTDQLKNEFSRKYGGKLVPADQADGILTGRITDIRTWTVARRGAQESLEKRVSVTIDLTLKGRDGEVLWFTRGMIGSDVYTVDQGDKAVTEANKRRAVELVCLRLGEEAYYRMTDDF